MSAMNNEEMMVPRDDLLLQVMQYPAQGNGHGLRVRQDGRYEALDNITWTWSDSNQPRAVKGASSWKLIWQFTPEELAELKEILAEADFAGMPEVIRPDIPVHDGTNEVWTVKDGESLIEVNLRPGAEPPAIKQLWQRFNNLRQPPEQSSMWSLWNGAAQIHRRLIGNVSAVDVFRGLIQALYLEGPAPVEAPGLPPPPDDIPLVSVTWHSDAAPTEVNILYADGRFKRSVQDGDTAISQLPQSRVQRVMAALSERDWAELPDPIVAE